MLRTTQTGESLDRPIDMGMGGGGGGGGGCSQIKRKGTQD